VKHDLRFEEIHAQAKILAWRQVAGIVGLNESAADIENNSTIIEFAYNSGADLLANLKRWQRNGLWRNRSRPSEALP
jgi:hypothetical protein